MYTFESVCLINIAFIISLVLLFAKIQLNEKCNWIKCKKNKVF